MKLMNWTIREILGRDAFVSTSEGYRLRTMSRNFTSLCIYLTGERDGEFKAFIQKNLKSGDVFVDVGANIGVYTALASHVVGPTGKVISFEANPSTYDYLKSNIDLNAFLNVQAINCALGDETGEIGMNCNDGNAGETHIAAGEKSNVLVPLKRLDDVLKEAGVEKVDYMKIDVEGFELQVLRGAAVTIGANQRIVVQTELVDTHASRYGYSISDVVEFMSNLGMEPFKPNAEGLPIPVALADIGTDWDVLWIRGPVGSRISSQAGKLT